MELELWSEVERAIRAVEAGFPRHPRDRYSTADVVRVYLFVCLHDRPTTWGCVPANWRGRVPRRPAALPDQSTMSRRTRRADFWPFLERVGRRLNATADAEEAAADANGGGGGGGAAAGRLVAIRVVDGKALELPNHTTDPDATWGRGVSRTSVGYKIHSVSSGKPMPDALAITTLNVCEKQMAARLIRRVAALAAAAAATVGGYLLGDGHFDASWLFDACALCGHQLVCPRAKPGTGEGHHYVSTHRRRAIAMLEVPAVVNRFGRELYARRTAIEREFAQLVCFGAGLGHLPSWVRRIWRVRPWVMTKLLINAARVLIRRRRQRAAQAAKAA